MLRYPPHGVEPNAIRRGVGNLHDPRVGNIMTLDRKQIIWQSANATDAEVNAKEIEYIRLLRSNETEIGYNRWPKP